MENCKNIINKNFSTVLKKIREKKGLTQVDIANAIGVTRQAIAAYESGKREPSFVILFKIANFMDVSIDYLLGRIKSSEYETFVIAKNIRIIRMNKPFDDFARDIGNKTGITVSPEKLELFENALLKPKNGELFLLSKYAEVDIHFFYKDNDINSYKKYKKVFEEISKKRKKINLNKNLSKAEISKWVNDNNNLQYISLAMELEKYKYPLASIVEIIEMIN